MKYIVMQVNHAGMTREFPVLFPAELGHIDVFDALRTKCPELTQATAVSGGEISSLNIEPGCYGRSSTLNVNSREKVDDQLITMRDYNAGIVG